MVTAPVPAGPAPFGRREELITDGAGRPAALVVVEEGEDVRYDPATGLPAFLEFVVYPLRGTENGAPLYERDDGGALVATAHRDDARWFARGCVQRSGCVSWETDCEEDLHHHCDGQSLRAVLQAVDRAYAVALAATGGATPGPTPGA